MKTKNILILSLATNVVLLSALAYIQGQDIDPGRVPPIIYLIDRADSETVSAAVEAARFVEFE